jgi:uncharacterized repeat protein (TIGR01451 family)
MCSRFYRIAFSFALGLSLLIGMALALQISAAPADRAGWQPEPDLMAAAISPAAMPTLTLAIAASDNFPAPGSTLRYSITLRNTGDAPANAATMSNTLPAGLEIVSGTLAATAGAATYDPISRTVHWGGDLAAGGRQTVTYAAVLNTADYIYNSATVSHPLAARPAGAVSSPADYWGDAEVLDSVHTFANTLGGYRHIAVDAAGAPHIAYGGNDLFYATPTTGVADNQAVGWRIETADTGSSYGAALVLDDQGRALIAYASGTSLWLARQTSPAPGSAWTTERIVQYTYWTLLSKLDLRRGADGRLHLAYNRDDEIYYTVHDGTAWSPPAVVIPKAACDLAAWGAGFSLALAACRRGSFPASFNMW